MLLGRSRERQAIDAALARARLGESATLAFLGEPGIGKTALLGYAAERADGMQLLRARGIESEAQVPFGALLELLRPALLMLDRIPAPQAVALESALALRPGEAQERFAVGAATLSLLAAYAEEGPLAVLIDDAHWLDESSAQALLFAFRRLVADPIAVILSVREEDPSLLDDADISTLPLPGLTSDESAELLPGVSPQLTAKLHNVTGGNPLALLELASEAEQLELAPLGAPVLVPTKIARAFLRRVHLLEPAERAVLVLAAASDSGDLAILERAASKLDLDLSALPTAESAELVRLRGGELEFRHPLARSAIYAEAPPEQRIRVHRALADSLPDRDVDRRAWHLAAAAVGTDDAAASALAQAGARGRERSAYATATAAFERAARLAAEPESRAALLWEAADTAWLAGMADHAIELLDHSRELSHAQERMVHMDHLAGQIALRRGPVMRGHAILVAAAEQAEPELAVLMLSEAAGACFAAGAPAEMLRTAARGAERLAAGASAAPRFLVAMSLGMANVLGGDAEDGARLIHEAIAIVEAAPDLRSDPRLLPWLVLAPVFLRERASGREFIDQALEAARARAAVGTLPLLLNLVARDQATTDRWAVAEATHIEAIHLARESGQYAELTFALASHAWLQARRGREEECRELVAEALVLAGALGLTLYEIWATAALGELELALGRTEVSVEHFERLQALLEDCGITDPDVAPAPELVEAYLRLGRDEHARRLSERFAAIAAAKGQPWSLARALRSQAMLAEDADADDLFDRALAIHAQTPDAFQIARTCLAYGERLRRSRQRVRAREQLRTALEIFERLDARPWAECARVELAASGETLRRRDPTTLDDLTPQELQIGLLLAGGRTTREAAAALFLSPKTVEYHLRHVYQKLGIGSRQELAGALADQVSAGEAAFSPSA